MSTATDPQPTPETTATQVTHCSWCPDPRHPSPAHHPDGKAEHVAEGGRVAADRGEGVMTATRELVAIHEAGHAVVSVRLDVPFRYVTLQARGAVGRVKARQRKSGCECWRIAAAAAAGPLVQDIATGCRNRPGVLPGARLDFAEVRDCARLIWQAARRGEPTGMDLPRRATVRKIAEVAWVEAHRIVAADYGAVLAVAEALLRSPRALTGAEVRRLVDGAHRVEPPAVATLAGDFWPSWFMRDWWTPEPPRLPRLIDQRANTDGPY